MVQEMYQLKVSLKTFLNTNCCKIGQQIAQNKLEETENFLTKMTASKNANTVREHLNTIENEDGKFSQAGFWKLIN